MGTDNILTPKLPHKKKKMILNSAVKEIRDRQDDPRSFDMQQSRIFSPWNEQKQSKLKSDIKTANIEDSQKGESCSRLNQKFECIGRKLQQSPIPIRIKTTPKYNNQRVSTIE